MNYPTGATMKVDDRISNYMSLLLGDSAKPASRVKENAGQQVPDANRVDSVSISPVSARMGEDEAHHARLIAIRQQLSEGTYNISGKDVAEKILKVLKS